MHKILTLLALLFVAIAAPVHATDEEDITQMLNDFLWGASIGSPAAHERFWAEDLVYTSSAGSRTDKETIMRAMDDVDEPAEDHEPEVVYTAEDVDIRLYGDTAVVAFKLVGTPTNEAAGADVLYYYNTGTFLKRDGVWKVVAWQATKIPPNE